MDGMKIYTVLISSLVIMIIGGFLIYFLYTKIDNIKCEDNIPIGNSNFYAADSTYKCDPNTHELYWTSTDNWSPLYPTLAPNSNYKPLNPITKENIKLSASPTVSDPTCTYLTGPMMREICYNTDNCAGWTKNKVVPEDSCKFYPQKVAQPAPGPN